MFNLFPFTNFHDLNMDWIIKSIKTLWSRAVFTVNNTPPDDNGNVNLPGVSGVSSVNGIGADGSGNVQLTANNVGAMSNAVSSDSATLETGWTAQLLNWIKLGNVVYVKVKKLQNNTGASASGNDVIATGFPVPLQAIGDATFLARKDGNASNPQTVIELRIATDGSLKFNFNGSMADQDNVDGYCVYLSN